MLKKASVVVASLGQYGPFKDGKTVRYVEVLDSEGGGVFRCTYAQGFDGAGIAPLVSGEGDIELFVKDGGIKARIHAFKLAATALPKAA